MHKQMRSLGREQETTKEQSLTGNSRIALKRKIWYLRGNVLLMKLLADWTQERNVNSVMGQEKFRKPESENESKNSSCRLPRFVKTVEARCQTHAGQNYQSFSYLTKTHFTAKVHQVVFLVRDCLVSQRTKVPALWSTHLRRESEKK